MKFSIATLFVLLIHYLIIFQFDFLKEEKRSTTVTKKNNSTKIFLKKYKKHKKHRTKKIKHNLKRIKIQDLSYNMNSINNLSPSYTKGNLGQYSLLIEVYSRIENNLNYPLFLKELHKIGIVKATIYFNKKGEYLEDTTQIQGPQFLKVTVAKMLRRTFKTKLATKTKNLSGIFVNSFFDFRLTTNQNENKKSELFSNYLYFYRSGYGGETGVDYLNKTLTGITNIFSLLHFLSKSNKHKQEIIMRAEEYKRDLAW